jgi:beta-lactamase class A
MNGQRSQTSFLSQLRVLDSCSFSGEDIRGGRIVEYRAQQVCPIASCAKLLVLASISRLIRGGHLAAGIRLKVRPQERIAGSGILKYQEASSLTVEQLCLAMICASDNTAYNKLYQVVGKNSINSFLELAGMRRTRIQQLRDGALGKNISCTSDYRVFWSTAQINANREFDFFFRILRRNKSRMFMGALLPGADIFHKTGVLDHSANLCINDTGIIRASKSVYSLTFFCRRQRNLEESGLKIAILSKMFLDSMSCKLIAGH